MKYRTDDLRIKEIKELLPPARLLSDFPITEKAAQTVYETRQAIHRILHGADDRLLAVMGPCSIHDVKAAKEYAVRLLKNNRTLTRVSRLVRFPGIWLIITGFALELT